MIFFPFSSFWPIYLVFVLFVLLMLALDLGVFHKKLHVVSAREASIWTVFWILTALLFNLLLYFFSKDFFAQINNFQAIYGLSPEQMASKLGLEFLTGFLIEKTLAIDNIFVFAIVFSFFKIPKLYQHRILFWGILGALAFRGLFIGLGSVLMDYKFIIIFFGLILIFTGLKIVFKKSDETNLEKNIILKTLIKFLNIDPNIEDQSFIKKINGKIFITPLLLALIFIEISDIVFAIDSVPAIFSITKEPFIVFTSNIFAIMGLRSMYFMLMSSLDRFYYIKYGLAGVLVFVGLKMVYLNEYFDGKFPISWSLGIILFIITSSILLSLFKRGRDSKI
jgi:tellurite resistance protein TerC